MCRRVSSKVCVNKMFIVKNVQKESVNCYKTTHSSTKVCVIYT